MLFNLNRGVFTEKSYQYPGESEFVRSGAEFMFAMKTSSASGSVFRLLKSIPQADICLVAGGAVGDKGGDRIGGSGGEVVNVTNVFLPAGDYTVIVGESGQNTSIVAPDGRTWTARSGYGASGGNYGHKNGYEGQLAWNDANTTLRPGWIYGSGGGYGFYRNTAGTEQAGGVGGNLGTAPAGEHAGDGGILPSHPDGYPGWPNTGQGGGAGTRDYYQGLTDYDGGAGGSGVVLIRKHKEVT